MAVTTTSTSNTPTSLYPIPSITSYTNLGPMPTTITFPPNCQTDVYDFGISGIGVPWTYYTQGCALSTCCPSQHVYSSSFEWYSNYYSPGVCPYGYTAGPADPIISTRSSETVKWCCPSSFGVVSSANGIPTPATTPYLNGFCQRQYYNLSSSAYVYNDIFDQKFESVENINSWYYAAYPLQIRWKAGDFDNIATLTSAASIVSGSLASNIAQPSPLTSPASPVASGSPSSSALSSGVIAAIAVVVGVAFLAALIALVWWLRRRSRKRADLSTISKNQYSAAMQEDPLNANFTSTSGAFGRPYYKSELSAEERAELESGQEDPAELDGRSSRAELR